jgi:glutathione peroxidase
MKRIHWILLVILLSASSALAQQNTFYDLEARTIEGAIFDFSTLKGKKVLIVNTATECALTPQFIKLQALYEEYGGDDFEIIAFPSNDFGNQEPGSNDQILEFCTRKYNVSFLLMEKISIKGDDLHPVYKWLTSSQENGTLDARVIWNFQKFLVDEEGVVVESLSPVTGPQNRRILEWLQEGLQEQD